MPKRSLAYISIEIVLMVNKKLCCSNTFIAEEKAVSVSAHDETDVARSTNVACHRAFGIFAKEVKL